MNSQLDIVDNW